MAGEDGFVPKDGGPPNAAGLDGLNLKLKLDTLCADEAFVTAAVVVVTERKTELVAVVTGPRVKLLNSGFVVVVVTPADAAAVVAALKLNVGSPLKQHYYC